MGDMWYHRSYMEVVAVSMWCQFVDFFKYIDATILLRATYILKWKQLRLQYFAAEKYRCVVRPQMQRTEILTRNVGYNCVETANNSFVAEIISFQYKNVGRQLNYSHIYVLLLYKTMILLTNYNNNCFYHKI